MRILKSTALFISISFMLLAGVGIAFFLKQEEDVNAKLECYRSGGFEFREHSGMFIGGHVCIHQIR